MKEKYSKETYIPPEVEVQKVQVELGFFGTYPSGGGGGGGGGSTPEDDPLYEGLTPVTDMPIYDI